MEHVCIIRIVVNQPPVNRIVVLIAGSIAKLGVLIVDTQHTAASHIADVVVMALIAISRIAIPVLTAGVLNDPALAVGAICCLEPDQRIFVGAVHIISQHPCRIAASSVSSVCSV